MGRIRHHHLHCQSRPELPISLFQPPRAPPPAPLASKGHIALTAQIIGLNPGPQTPLHCAPASLWPPLRCSPRLAASVMSPPVRTPRRGLLSIPRHSPELRPPDRRSDEHPNGNLHLCSLPAIARAGNLRLHPLICNVRPRSLVDWWSIQSKVSQVSTNPSNF